MSGHNVNCARRLRASLLEQAGNPADPQPYLLQAVAEEIVRCCGHRPLKGHRLARAWTVEAAVAAFHAMCREGGLGARGLTVRSWLEWEAGEHPNSDYQDLLCRLFRADPVGLGFRQAYGQPDVGLGTGQAHGSGPGNEPGDLVSLAARQSLAHVAVAELSDAGPMLLDLLEEDVRRLARAYLHDAPLPVFTELVRIRRDACRLLAGRLTPCQGRRVMLLAGQACGLLANSSLDLGSPGAATTQARAAMTYATALCHDGLSAWIRGMQAMIAYWSQDLASAVALARDGQRFAASATARARLHAIEALACATIGAQRESLAALDAAERARQLPGCADDIHDAVGGEFGFTPAKRSYLAGSTYVRLGWQRQAIAAAGQAIRLYEEGPASERSYGNEALARADLVSGYVLAGDLDAACESAARIFELPHDQRIDGVSVRLDGIGRLLCRSRYQRAPQALELIDRIACFRPRQGVGADWRGLSPRPG